MDERQYEEAAIVLEETLANTNGLFSFPDSRLYENHFALGQAQMKLGRYQLAEANVMETVKIAEAIYGSNSLRSHGARMFLAMVLGYQGKYGEAREYWERAKPYVESDPSTVGDYAIVKKAYDQMMAEAESGFVVAADQYVNHAMNMERDGHSDQAERVLKDALSYFENVAGKDHESTTMLRQRLQQLGRSRGRS